MPELPEVETVCRGLRKNIIGKRISKLQIRISKLRWVIDKNKLQQAVINEKIISVERRAKYILINLNNRNTIVIHLGMTGNLRLKSQSVPLEKHDHLIFSFDDKSEIRFHDPRRFGMVEAVSANEMSNYSRFANLGPEPLEKSTRAADLYKKSSKSKKPIKNVLMDAKFLAGVGNIYASEALYYARIHPEKISNTMTRKQWTALLRSVRKVLKAAIKKGGTTLSDFANSEGNSGYFQLSLAVYGREGEKCPSCKTKIEKFTQSGRSSFYCPSCQSID